MCKNRKKSAYFLFYASKSLRKQCNALCKSMQQDAYPGISLPLYCCNAVVDACLQTFARIFCRKFIFVVAGFRYWRYLCTVNDR